MINVSGSKSQINKVAYVKASTSASRFSSQGEIVSVTPVAVDKNGREVPYVVLMDRAVTIEGKILSKKTVNLHLDTLSKYSILTESIYPITSVTVKNSRIYQNKTGGYIYRNIKDELFCGYTIQKYSDKEIYIATKEKALFDYLYYKSPTLPAKLKNINLVEELRLNIYDFKKKELNMLRKYAKISKSKKIYKIVENIIQNVHTYN